MASKRGSPNGLLRHIDQLLALHTGDTLEAALPAGMGLNITAAILEGLMAAVGNELALRGSEEACPRSI